MISIIIPMHNEQEVLLRLYGRLSRAAAEWGRDYEVIAVDDGSKDSTAELLQAIHLFDPRWKSLHFSRNFGQQAAISAGLQYCAGDAVAILDADLQDPPEVVGRLLDHWDQGYKVVYAVRTKRKEAFYKRWAYAAFYRVLRRVASIDIPLDAGDFCVMDRQVVDALRALPENNRFVRGLRSWVGFRQIGVPYERDPRHAGEVKYTLTKLVRLGLDGLIAFSNVPLKAAAVVAGTMLVVALVLLLAAMATFILGSNGSQLSIASVTGWELMASLVLAAGSAQVMVTGLVGEYVARAFDQVKGRHPWIISSASGLEPDRHNGAKGWFVPEPPIKSRRIGPHDLRRRVWADIKVRQAG